MPEDTDVLIVGAGPVGLTMACYLHFHGVRFRIIDKNSHGTETSNAIGLQSRTLELLNTLGIADELVKSGNKLSNFHIQSNKKALANWNLHLIDSIYPYMLSVSQKITEHALLSYLSEAKISIERQTELITIDQNDSHIDIRMKTPEGEAMLRSKYISACDGYHSTVRDLSDIAYEGEDIPLNMLIMDAPLEWSSTKTHGYTAFTDTLSVILLPLENSWRIIADVANAPEFHCKSKEQPTEATFQRILDLTMNEKIKVKKALWASKFLIHERLARHYKKGRVFLTGDAAHAHSPAGGQGMNTGMQDAVNLAWKLAFVLKGHAKEALLNSYERERRPVAKEIIRFSGLLTRFGTLRNKYLIMIRDFFAARLSKLSFLQKRFGATVSELEVNYRGSDLSRGRKRAGLKPGDRMPKKTWDLKEHMDKHFLSAIGKKFILLDFHRQNERLFSDYSETVYHVKVPSQANEIAKIFGMENGGYALIRPDQYISYMGNNLNEIRRFLHHIHQ